MLKLKLQYFGHLMQRTGSFVNTLMLVKIEGGKRRGRQRMRWLDSITHSMDMSLSELRELVAVHGVAKCRTLLSDWTELTECYSFSFSKHWNMYITICKIDSQWKFAVWRMELKPSVLSDNLEVQEGGDICIPMADSCWWQKWTQYCKAIILQLKINTFKLK